MEYSLSRANQAMGSVMMPRVNHTNSLARERFTCSGDISYALAMLIGMSLLLAASLPVKDIAIERGCYDISSFNRRFKAHTGMALLQHRQACTSRDMQSA